MLQLGEPESSMVLVWCNQDSYLLLLQPCRWEIRGSGSVSLASVSIGDATLHICSTREGPTEASGGVLALEEAMQRQAKGAEHPPEVQNPQTPPMTVFGPEAVPFDAEDTVAERSPAKVHTSGICPKFIPSI